MSQDTSREKSTTPKRFIGFITAAAAAVAAVVSTVAIISSSSAIAEKCEPPGHSTDTATCTHTDDTPPRSDDKGHHSGVVQATQKPEIKQDAQIPG